MRFLWNKKRSDIKRYTRQWYPLWNEHKHLAQAIFLCMARHLQSQKRPHSPHPSDLLASGPSGTKVEGAHLQLPMPSSCCQLVKHSDKENFCKRPLSIVFEKSRQLGEVPEAWKQVNVAPVFPKGTKEDLHNSRLVCLTSIPGIPDKSGPGSTHAFCTDLRSGPGFSGPAVQWTCLWE